MSYQISKCFPVFYWSNVTINEFLCQSSVLKYLIKTDLTPIKHKMM